MAADRATELTEAYRILSDTDRRNEYDRTLDVPPLPVAATAPPPIEDESRPLPNAFREERASRDEYMRKAALSRFKQPVDAVAPRYDHAAPRPFRVLFL